MKAATCDIDGSNIREVTDSPALFPNTRRYKVVTPGNKGTLDVLVVDAKHAGAPMDWLVAGMDSVDSENTNLLGLDSESVNRKVVLLQLSTSKRCLVIRLPKKMNINKRITSVMANERISKVGAELYGDALDLMYDHQIRVNGLINLTPHYPNGYRSLGLRRMFLKEYAVEWVKDKVITCSDWSAPLSEVQIKYAALDAWVSYMVGAKLLVRKPNIAPVNIDLWSHDTLMRIAVIHKQKSLLQDIQRKTFKVTGSTEVQQKDPELVDVAQTRYEKRVRMGYNIIAVTADGKEVKGRVQSTKGKRATLKMGTKMTGQVVEYKADNFNEKDIVMEAQQKAIENILESREISSPLLRLLLDTTSSVSPLSSALNTTSSVAPLPIKSSTLDSTSLFTQSLNPSQRSAVETAIKNPITMIHGPPGTGKTTTIACIAQCLTSAPHNEVVVIAAKQNVAALNVLLALRKRGVKGCVLFVSEEYYIEWHEDDYESFVNTHVVVGGTFDPLPGWQRHNPGLLYPKVVVCTTGCLTACSQTFLDVIPKRFSTLMVDESSQMWMGEVMPILNQHEKKLKRLVMVGDHKQLAPYGSQQMEEAQLDGKSVFERCINERRFSYQLLNEQYRMPPAIGGFISNSFYSGALTTCHTAVLPPFIETLTRKRVLWVDTKGEEAKSVDTKSSYNLEEIRQVVQLVYYFTRFLKEAQRVVVISPYEEQRSRIEEELKRLPHLRKLFKNQTIVYCIDGYQGREADVVITSLVRCNYQGSLGFLKKNNRLNVMLSRAKTLMCVVGHVKTMQRSKRSNLFTSLLQISDKFNSWRMRELLERANASRTIQEMFHATPMVSTATIPTRLTSSATIPFQVRPPSLPSSISSPHPFIPSLPSTMLLCMAALSLATPAAAAPPTPLPRHPLPRSPPVTSPPPLPRPPMPLSRSSPVTSPTLTTTTTRPSVSFWEFLCANPDYKVTSIGHLRKIYKRQYLQSQKVQAKGAKVKKGDKRERKEDKSDIKEEKGGVKEETFSKAFKQLLSQGHLYVKGETVVYKH